MWSPIDIFFIAWFCNFSPCQDARLSVAEIVELKERGIIVNSFLDRHYPFTPISFDVELRNDN